MVQQSPKELLSVFLATEQVRLRKSFTQLPELGYDSRYAIMELVRGIDYVFSRPLLTMQSNPPALDGLYAIGTSNILSIFVDECIDRSGVPVVPSHKNLQQWANSCIQHAGKLVQLERLLEAAHDGLYEITQKSASVFEMKPIQFLTDEEAFDVADQQWLRKLISQRDEPLAQVLSKQLPDVLAQMHTLVYPWQEHFIAYGTNPLIDDHYDRAGVLWSHTLDGQMELPHDSIIGGLPFQLYRATVELFCGRALKHASYAGELSLMQPDLDLRNLLTMWSTREKWIEFIQGCLDVDAAAARQLLWSITLDRNYWHAFTNLPGHPIPPLLQISRDHLLLCVTGCLSSPFWFLGRKLRHEFRSDWDGIVDRREDQFRTDVYSLWVSPQIVTVDHPVRIRCSGNDLTDIDGILFDKQHGTLILLQLKWQDQFGFSMRERRSRMRNLIISTNRWIKIMREWISTTSDTTKIASLGLPIKSKDSPIRRVELMVVARHHARFTGSERPSPDAAWGTWPQLCRIVNEENDGGDLLSHVIEQLCEEQNRSESPRELRAGSLDIGNISVRILAS